MRLSEEMICEALAVQAEALRAWGSWYLPGPQVRGTWGTRLSARGRFVLSHPFRKERGMDGAPSIVSGHDFSRAANSRFISRL